MYRQTPQQGDQYVGAHGCCTCRDARFVRTTASVFDPPTAQIQPCPDCVGSDTNKPTTRERLVRVARIPRLHQTKRFDDFNPEHDPQARHAAQDFVKLWPPAKPLLTFTSPEKGNGKTLLACCTLQAAFERHGVWGLFWPVVDLLEAYRLAYGNDRDGTLGLVNAIDQRAFNSPFLVLDDIGAERETDWTRDRLFQIIDRRYRDLIPTLFTTNVTLDAIDERIASRLSDAHVGEMVVLRGPDQRGVER